ncbi:MAG: prolipoprotein diacylglyceryl transferase family protein [Bryobacteraceae bacterium]
MIPYFAQPVWHIGRLEIHAFGIAAALALNAGFFIVLWRARVAKLDQHLAARLYLLLALAGAIAGHAFLALLNGGPPWLRIWDGQSATGVAIGGSAAAGIAYVYLSTIEADPWAYCNALAFAFPFVWTVLRAGCALAHDHPGRSTHSPFGVRFPGGTRYDLGLLEFLAAAILCVVFLVLAHAGWRRFLPLVLIAGGAVRLALYPLRLPGAAGSVAGIAVSFLTCIAGLTLLTFGAQGRAGITTSAR